MRISNIAWSAIAACVLLVAAVSAANAGPLSTAPACTIFPSDSAWNQKVDTLPTIANSDEVITSVGANTNLINVFGAAKSKGQPIGVPVKVVGGTQKKVKVKFTYPLDSDVLRYPLPKSLALKGGKKPNRNRLNVVVDKTNCLLYELVGAYPTNKKSTRWAATIGAKWDLKTNTMRKKGIASATRSGLPVLPGLVRYEDVARGVIDHALAFKVPQVRSTFQYPASRSIGTTDDSRLPMFGQRVRLKASVDLSTMGPQAQIIAQAMKTYGAIFSEVGTPWMFLGTPSKNWKDVELNALKQLKGSDFEVVDTSSLPTPGL